LTQIKVDAERKAELWRARLARKEACDTCMDCGYSKCG
jgi:hypothetical protein